MLVVELCLVSPHVLEQNPVPDPASDLPRLLPFAFLPKDLAIDEEPREVPATQSLQRPKRRVAPPPHHAKLSST